MHRLRLAVMIACLVATGWWFGQMSAQGTRRYIEPRTADSTGAPFSGGVLLDDVFFVSGTLGLEAGQKVPATPEAEATNMLNNVQNTLKQAGLTMDDLVSVQIFCSDVAHYDAFNKIYRGYFKREYPSRAFIGSGKLLFGARFEIQGVAVKRP